MDCYNTNCPFRENESSNIYRCECVACVNRDDGQLVFVSNRTLAESEIEQLSRQKGE